MGPDNQSVEEDFTTERAAMLAQVGLLSIEWQRAGSQEAMRRARRSWEAAVDGLPEPLFARHLDAWRIISDDSRDYGVLVRCGPREHPYWWLLCPATATLYIGDDPDLTDCHDGLGCDWVDVHKSAHLLRRQLVREAG